MDKTGTSLSVTSLSVICETSRLTRKRIELSESMIEILNSKICYLMTKAAEHPVISVTYYVADAAKEGGAYVKSKGSLKKIDTYKRIIILEDFSEIPIEDIADVESDLFLHEE